MRRRTPAVLRGVWIVGAIASTLILGVQTFGNHYGSRTGAAWAWLAPVLYPITTLIWTGSPADTDSAGKEPGGSGALGVFMSLVHFAVVLTVILAPISAVDRLAWMARSSYVLAGIQVLLILGLKPLFKNL